MKKLLTLLTLAGALLLTAAAQEISAPPAEKQPFFGPGHYGQDCPGFGKMHDNMKRGEAFGKRGEGKEHFGPRMIEFLELSKDQADKIHDIRIRYEKAEIGLEADLKKLKIDKREAMRELNFDEAKKAVKQMSDIKTKIQISRIDEMSEMVKVLNKEQTDKFRELHDGRGMMKPGMPGKKK